MKYRHSFENFVLGNTFYGKTSKVLLIGYKKSNKTNINVGEVHLNFRSLELLR